MTVDLTQVVQALLGLCATAITVLGGLVLTKLAKKLGVETNKVEVQKFDDALQKALTSATVQLSSLIAQKGWDHPDVKNLVVATALSGMVQNFPKALAGVGLSPDPKDPNNAGIILNALQRAWPEAAAVAAASPATPGIKS